MTYLCTWPACKTAGCIDCNEAVELPDDDERDDYADEEEREPPEFGCCLPPGECCMPGLHFPSECHTAADYEREQFGGWASDAGPRKTPNVRGNAQATAAQEHANEQE